MLETKVVNEDRPKFDKAIIEFIESEEFFGGGNKMVIGVENENNEIYRVIETTGLGDFMATVNFLADLGLDDILSDSTKMVDGFDARFRIEPAN